MFLSFLFFSLPPWKKKQRTKRERTVQMAADFAFLLYFSQMLWECQSDFNYYTSFTFPFFFNENIRYSKIDLHLAHILMYCSECLSNNYLFSKFNYLHQSWKRVRILANCVTFIPIILPLVKNLSYETCFYLLLNFHTLLSIYAHWMPRNIINSRHAHEFRKRRIEDW